MTLKNFALIWPCEGCFFCFNEVYDDFLPYWNRFDGFEDRLLDICKVEGGNCLTVSSVIFGGTTGNCLASIL